MKRIVFILLLLLVVGCRQSQQEETGGTADLTIELLAPLQPTMDGSSEMSVRVTDAAGAPVNDASLSIKGDMTHAGMMPVLADASGGEDGLYTFPFAWTMTGDWIVTVRATLPDDTWAEQQFDLTVK
ncbi:MAG: FixH family protein [Anaerolineales bacterium]|nr:FixH family protein [Anaerolineales bacterium]MCB8967915.1 FixH family protein [Ardenticatenaceae bacterium]